MHSMLDKKPDKTDDAVIEVRLFGSLELENHHGIAAEPPVAEQILFRLMKHLLIEPTQESQADELITNLVQEGNSCLRYPRCLARLPPPYSSPPTAFRLRRYRRTHPTSQWQMLFKSCLHT